MINDKSDWYSVFDNHKTNIRTIVSTYNRQDLEKFDLLSSEKLKNGLQLISVLNVAWFNAPDSKGVHYIPSWSAICNLCSESWVFEDEYEIENEESKNEL